MVVAVHRAKVAAGLLISCFSLIAPVPAYAMTGGEWYDACMELLVMWPEQRKNAAPEKKVKYRACQLAANHAYCEMKMEPGGPKNFDSFGPERQEQIYQELSNACPKNFPGAPYKVILRDLEKRSGPNLLERWLPASNLLTDTLRTNYPLCGKLREQYGLAASAADCFEGWTPLLD